MLLGEGSRGRYEIPGVGETAVLAMPRTAKQSLSKLLLLPCVLFILVAALKAKAVATDCFGVLGIGKPWGCSWCQVQTPQR